MCKAHILFNINRHMFDKDKQRTLFVPTNMDSVLKNRLREFIILFA